MINILDFGANPNGRPDDTGTNSDAAFAAALATRESTILLPAGNYLLCQDLVLSRRVTLVGDGGLFRASATTLRLKGEVGGDPRNTATIRVRQGGSHSVLSRLCICGDRAVPRPTALVEAHAAVHLTECYIRDAGGHGVHIDGSRGVGNANFWSIRDVFIENCGETGRGRYAPGHYGLRVDGQDAQGDASGLRVISSWGGICDSSFLGCTWWPAMWRAARGRGIGRNPKDARSG